MPKSDGQTDRDPPTNTQKCRRTEKHTDPLTATHLHYPRRFLAWEKINSLIKSHTVPISKLGTTLAPSLKCLNPHRSQLIVQLKVEEEEEEEEERRSTAWSSFDPSYDEFSINAWEAPRGRGRGGDDGGSGISIRRHQRLTGRGRGSDDGGSGISIPRHQTPTGRKSKQQRVRLEIIRDGLSTARKSMTNDAIRVKGGQDYKSLIIR